MALPKKVKKYLPLIPNKVGKERRQEMLDEIQEKGTFLPKGVLHADLDRGMLDFVKESLKLIVDTSLVPTLDKIITTQGWSQFTETWDFKDLDENVKLPFICTIRQPEVKYGTNPSLLYTIPNRNQYYYAVVPNWNGNQKGADIYTIPQPVPVDINYNVKIICNRMRELNQFNKIVLQKFSSKQAYTFIKGQYVPIVSTNISDESVMDIDKRKYYIQNYDFTMLGYLIDEEEFEVKPAISRVLQLFELDTRTTKEKSKKYPENPNSFNTEFIYSSGVTSFTKVMEYRVNMEILSLENVDNYNVVINGDSFGQISTIPINNNDTLTISIVKTTTGESKIKFICSLI